MHGPSPRRSYRRSALSRAAIGLRPHSGWAALVAVTGDPEALTVLDRRRITLAGPGIPKQPYHAAEGLAAEKARERIRVWMAGSRRLAARALREVLGGLRRDGREVAACGLLLASGRSLPSLAQVLASHALIHTADGEHFREAIRHAARGARLPVMELREKEIWARASAQWRVPLHALERRIDGLGKAVGPPWTQDEKLAALVAAMALHGSGEPQEDRARGSAGHRVHRDPARDFPS